MEIVQIVVFALIAVIFAILLKSTRPEFALMIEIFAGAVILIFISSKIMNVYDIVQNFVHKANFDNTYFLILIKIVGIAYIAEFGISICKDANHSALASKIELSAKIIILIIALPVMSGLLDILTNIMK